MERFFYQWVRTSKDCRSPWACSGWLFKLDKRCILGHSSQCFSSDLGNSISGQPTLLSCQYQNIPQENHCGDDLLPCNKWSLGRMRVFELAALPWLLSSLLEGPQLSALLPLCHHPGAWGVVISFFRRWYKDRQELFCFRCYFRVVEARVRYRFYKWRLNGVAIARLRYWGLRGWHWSRRTTGGARF